MSSSKCDNDSQLPSDGPGSSKSSVASIKRHRRGGAKSRRGCFSCKRRKIKCQETRPSCANCTKSGYPCAYPDPIIPPAGIAPNNALQTPAIQTNSLQPNPIRFSMSDMKLFHHYLLGAFPHLPVDSEKFWLVKVPAIAYEYEYLMHSLLGLAASHLTAISSENFAAEALTHRGTAIGLLIEQISIEPRNQLDVDARLAAMMTLIFQSLHLDGGLTDFLTMIRGCHIVTGKEGFYNANSDFYGFRPEGHNEAMTRRLEDSTNIQLDPKGVEGGQASLQALQALEFNNVESDFCSHMKSVLDLAPASPIDAYKRFTYAYSYSAKLSVEEFAAFITPQNQVARVLLAHFIAINRFLGPVAMYEINHTQRVFAPSAMGTWVLNIYKDIDPAYRKYLSWPLYVYGLDPGVELQSSVSDV